MKYKLKNMQHVLSFRTSDKHMTNRSGCKKRRSDFLKLPLKDMSRREIAEKLRVNPATVSRWRAQQKAMDPDAFKEGRKVGRPCTLSEEKVRDFIGVILKRHVDPVKRFMVNDFGDYLWETGSLREAFSDVTGKPYSRSHPSAVRRLLECYGVWPAIPWSRDENCKRENIRAILRKRAKDLGYGLPCQLLWLGFAETSIPLPWPPKGRTSGVPSASTPKRHAWVLFCFNYSRRGKFSFRLSYRKPSIQAFVRFLEHVIGSCTLPLLIVCEHASVPMVRRCGDSLPEPSQGERPTDNQWVKIIPKGELLKPVLGQKKLFVFDRTERLCPSQSPASRHF